MGASVMSESFNLRHLIREVLTSSLMADPRALATEVLGRIPADQVEAALSECLPDVVREEIRCSRNRATNAAPMGERPGSAPSGRSAKVAGIREMWQAKLRERLHVGPSPSDWRLLGDCTAEHLDFAAAERREQAARCEARAEEYGALAGALRAAGVKRVRDLPAATLRTRLGESEAA
jgi:hypothetical protein